MLRIIKATYFCNLQRNTQFVAAVRQGCFKTPACNVTRPGLFQSAQNKLPKQLYCSAAADVAELEATTTGDDLT
jgi:hypothetical protein